MAVIFQYCLLAGWGLLIYSVNWKLQHLLYRLVPGPRVVRIIILQPAQVIPQISSCRLYFMSYKLWVISYNICVIIYKLWEARDNLWIISHIKATILALGWSSQRARHMLAIISCNTCSNFRACCAWPTVGGSMTIYCMICNFAIFS